MALNRLPEDGELQLAAVRLPPGRRIHAGLRSGGPVAWAFLLGVLAVSARWYSARAKWIIPKVIFFACFLQGYLSAELIAGINAIGHS